MPAHLFSEFAPNDKATWRKQIEKELKGGIYNLKNWKIDTSTFVEPYLTLEDLDLKRVNSIQSAQKKIPGWINISSVDSDHPVAANVKIKKALASGADGIYLNILQADLAKCEFPKLLHGINLSEKPVFFGTNLNPGKLFDLISNGAGYYIKGGICYDPIANWMKKGVGFDESILEIKNVLLRTKNMREFRPFAVESLVYHSAGATPVQEIAYVLSALVTYVDKLTNLGVPALLALNRFCFSISIGTEFLTEIAKLRALRYLYHKICRAFKLPDDLCRPFVYSTTSAFLETQNLPHNNIVRATSEATSAIIGGCDALTVRPYDKVFSDTNEFSERIARNISLIIERESYLGQVADPTAGSYFIEDLTSKMAEAAWNLFLQTEEQGGIIKSFEAGSIQNEIEKSWNDKLRSMNGERVIIGVNKYQNNTDQTELHANGSFKTSDESSSFRKLPSRNLSKNWLAVSEGL